MKHPTEYRIEVYLNSFINDPIASFCSTTPFMTFQIGDEIDPYAWSRSNEESFGNPDEVASGKVLEIIKIRHLMMIAGDKIIQSSSLKVNEINRED